jgi:predicted metal-dependent HD superfamily phosphohydrolase
MAAILSNEVVKNEIHFCAFMHHAQAHRRYFADMPMDDCALWDDNQIIGNPRAQDNAFERGAHFRGVTG